MLIFFTPLYNISNSELLEEYDWAYKFLNDEDGEVNEKRLFFFRSVLFIFSCSCAFFTDKVTVVLSLGGALVIPIISFYLPVLLNFMYEAVYKKKRSKWMHLHDFMIVLFGFAVQVLSLSYTINHQMDE